MGVDMDASRDHQRGLEAGFRWAEHAPAHDVATVMSKSFDDLSAVLPREVSHDFVVGFREAVVHVWRNEIGITRDTVVRSASPGIAIS
jgi:hypothetical protein